MTPLYLRTALVSQRISSGAGVSAFLRQHGIARTTYYRWVNGDAAAPIEFYALLSREFGGEPLDYATEVAPR